MVSVTHFVDPAAAAQILLDSFTLTYGFPKWTQGGAFKVNLCSKRITLLSVLLWSHFSRFFKKLLCFSKFGFTSFNVVSGRKFYFQFYCNFYFPIPCSTVFIFVLCIAFQKSKKILNKTQKIPIFHPSVIT